MIKNQSKGTVTNNVQACCLVLIRPEEVHVHTHTHTLMYKDSYFYWIFPPLKVSASL